MQASTTSALPQAPRLPRAAERLFVLQSAGNLATTRRCSTGSTATSRTAGEPRASRRSGTCSRRRSTSAAWRARSSLAHRRALPSAPTAPATFLLGGQIGRRRPDILLVYPEGNYIRASDDRPFLQIGESKYGKFLLERGRHRRPDLHGDEDRSRVDDEHARANLSVGPPYDAAYLANGSFAPVEHRFSADSPPSRSSARSRGANILHAVAELPDIWLPGLRARATRSGSRLNCARPFTAVRMRRPRSCCPRALQSMAAYAITAFRTLLRAASQDARPPAALTACVFV